MAKTIIVSYSELDAFRQCNHKHELGYKERWQPPTTSPALAKGTLWHLVMEDHYRILLLWSQMKRPSHFTGKHMVMAGLKAPASEDVLVPIETALLEAAQHHLYDPLSGQYLSEHCELIEWMYTGYLETYGLDEGWRILAVEHGPEVWLATERGGRSRFKLKLKIDVIARDISTGKMWIWDHKTGRDLPKEKELDIDDQFGQYAWAMRKLGKPIFGILYNAARTYRLTSRAMGLEERFMRKRLPRTDKELDTIAVEAYQTAAEAYSSYNKGQRAPDSDRCRWRCDFTEACLLGRKGMDERQALIDLGFVQNFERH